MSSQGKQKFMIKPGPVNPGVYWLFCAVPLNAKQAHQFVANRYINKITISPKKIEYINLLYRASQLGR